MDAPDLRFLADESCDFALVRRLRAEGYDTLAVCEFARRSDDHEVSQLARRERRILLTEDKDFGQLVFASHAESAGVILIRFPGNARRNLVESVMQVVRQQGEQLFGAFVVVQPGYIRVGRVPFSTAPSR